MKNGRLSDLTLRSEPAHSSIVTEHTGNRTCQLGHVSRNLNPLLAALSDEDFSTEFPATQMIFSSTQET